MANDINLTMTIRAVDQARSVIGGISSALMNLASGNVLGAIAGVGEAMVGVGDAVAKASEAAVESSAQFEQMTVAMQTLLPVGNQAQQMMQNLWNFAAKTPFQFQDIDAAAQKLLAFKFNSQAVIPILTSIGDTLGALGKSTPAQLAGVVDIFGKIEAQGHLTAATMTQLARRGIPAWQELAQQMGVSVPTLQEMVKKGLVPADTAVKGLASGMEKTFGGGMAKQALTFNGLMTTVKDNIQAAMRSFAGPLFAAAKSALEGLGKLVSSDQFQAFAKNLGSALVPAMKGVFQIAGELGKVIGAVAQQVAPAIVAFGKWAQQHHLLQTVIQAIIVGIRAFGAGLHVVIPIIMSIAKAVFQFAQDIATRLQPIIAAFATWWKQHWQQIQAVLVGVWDFIYGFLKQVWNSISSFFKIALDALSGNWGQMWTDMGTFLSQSLDNFKLMIGGALQAILNILLAHADPIFHAIVDPFVNAWNSIPGVTKIPIPQLPKSVNFMGAPAGISQSKSSGGSPFKLTWPSGTGGGAWSLPANLMSGGGDTSGGAGTSTSTGKSKAKKAPSAKGYTAQDIKDIEANAKKMHLAMNDSLFAAMTAAQKTKYLDQLVGDNRTKLAQILKGTQSGFADYIQWELDQAKQKKAAATHTAKAKTGKHALTIAGSTGTVSSTAASVSQSAGGFTVINNVTNNITNNISGASDTKSLYDKIMAQMNKDLKRSGLYSSMTSGGVSSKK